MNQQSDFYIIGFDISDPKRLRKVAVQMENFGRRVQYSLFECHLNPTDLHELQTRLDTIIDPQHDHIRYYRLCPKDIKKIHIDGHGSVTQSQNYYLL